MTVGSPTTIEVITDHRTHQGSPMARKRPAIRCKAHRTDATPCRNFAMAGGVVCHAHGGRAPQVRRAAARRRQHAEALKVLNRVRVEREIAAVALAPYEDRQPSVTAWDALTEPKAVAARLQVEIRALEEEARARRRWRNELLAKPPADPFAIATIEQEEQSA